MSLKKHKRRECAQAIRLFCYQMTCPALNEGLLTKQHGKLMCEITADTYTDLFGSQIRILRETRDRWIQRSRGQQA
ncbi:hypothetical protein [Mycobacterium uberis]|uniref:hypothetical protein n=1 Tax=Mycobacterium uberis TaxID=2162698 RepID=UPI001402861A|nr:hypothetical protein [Mycobacterium uberis]